MFHFLGILFILLVVILVIGLSIIGTVLRAIFGLGGKRRTSSGQHQNGNGTYQSSGRGYSFSGNGQPDASSRADDTQDTTTDSAAYKKHKKLFGKDEGEYVDFEEIKE